MIRSKDVKVWQLKMPTRSIRYGDAVLEFSCIGYNSIVGSIDRRRSGPWKHCSNNLVVRSVLRVNSLCKLGVTGLWTTFCKVLEYAIAPNTSALIVD